MSGRELSSHIVNLELKNKVDEILYIISYLYNVGISVNDIAKLLNTSKNNVQEALKIVKELGLKNEKNAERIRKKLYGSNSKELVEELLIDWEKIITHNRKWIIEYDGEVYVKFSSKEVEAVIGFFKKIKNFFKEFGSNFYSPYVDDFVDKVMEYYKFKKGDRK